MSPDLLGQVYRKWRSLSNSLAWEEDSPFVGGQCSRARGAKGEPIIPSPEWGGSSRLEDNKLGKSKKLLDSYRQVWHYPRRKYCVTMKNTERTIQTIF